MHPRRRLGVVTATLVLAMGCVARYRQPAQDQPHANVQLRSIHDAELGPSSREQVRVDGRAVEYSEAGGNVRTTTVRVRPEPTAYDFHTELFHDETRWERETYTHGATVFCGYNWYGPQYCWTQWPATRMVPVVFRVSDGRCDAHFEQVPLPGATYVVQYELVGNGICRVTCQRLVEGANGARTATSCGTNEPGTGQMAPTSGGQTD
jgi:hypothetical protein